MPARLLRDKGIYEFVEAARRLSGRGYEFLVAGEADPGNPAAVPRSEVEDWQRAGLVQVLGHVDDMPTLFRSVDLVVLPSYREGLPRALVEAAACALPLVTTDVPGCREVVDDGVNGLLVPVRDPGALTRAIERMRAEPKLAQLFGQKARQKAIERFDQKAIVEATLSTYAELLEPAL